VLAHLWSTWNSITDPLIKDGVLILGYPLSVHDIANLDGRLARGLVLAADGASRSSTERLTSKEAKERLIDAVLLREQWRLWLIAAMVNARNASTTEFTDTTTSDAWSSLPAGDESGPDGGPYPLTSSSAPSRYTSSEASSAVSSPLSRTAPSLPVARPRRNFVSAERAGRPSSMTDFVEGPDIATTSPVLPVEETLPNVGANDVSDPALKSAARDDAGFSVEDRPQFVDDPFDWASQENQLEEFAPDTGRRSPTPPAVADMDMYAYDVESDTHPNAMTPDDRGSPPPPAARRFAPLPIRRAVAAVRPPTTGPSQPRMTTASIFSTRNSGNIWQQGLTIPILRAPSMGRGGKYRMCNLG
jgi:hypothetical protein